MGMDLALVVAVEKITNCLLAGRFSNLVFEKVEVVICIPIDDGNADVIVGVVRVGGLVDFGGAGGDDIWGVEFGVHSVCLTSVNHEEHFMVSVVVSLNPCQRMRLCLPLLLPHLCKGICQIESADFFCILKLEELVSTMASHIDQNVTPVVCQQSLTPGHVLAHAIGQQPNEVLYRNLIAPIIDLNVVSV